MHNLDMEASKNKISENIDLNVYYSFLTDALRQQITKTKSNHKYSKNISKKQNKCAELQAHSDRMFSVR